MKAATQPQGAPTNAWAGRGRTLHLREVGPRDGLQAETRFVPTADKIALIDGLAAAGFTRIEATAFVSPQAIPALRDAEELLHHLPRRAGVRYGALVPNLRGAERAIGAGADELDVVMSASESHNRANLRMSRAQSHDALARVAAAAHAAGVRLDVALSCAFGCPMEGELSEASVLADCAHFVERLGAQAVTLCDTTGMAHPGQVHALTRAVLARWPEVDWTLHFHDTRGMGLANLLAAIDAGARCFDTALGGLGGCPYAPGASGNVCSEDVVHALDAMGYDTGIDLPALIDLARRLPALVGHSLPGQIVKAGRRLDLYAMPGTPRP